MNVGNALPQRNTNPNISETRNIQPENCRQTFSNQPSGRLNFPLLRLGTSFLANGIRRTAQAVQSRFRASAQSNKVTEPVAMLREIFILNKRYFYPKSVRLFSPSDNSEQHPIFRRQFINWLTNNNAGMHDVNLAPRTQDPHGCETMLDLLKSQKIELEFEGLLGIWLSKMLDIDGAHFEKFVIGVGLLNFRNYKTTESLAIINRTVTALTEEMERIKLRYAIMYLGWCFHALRYDQAFFIEKKVYGVQNYLVKLLRGQKDKNLNEVMYSIAYHRTIEFFSTKQFETNTVTMRCVFDIFRIKVEERDKTLLTISSCFPLGLLENIKCFGWKKDLNLVNLFSLKRKKKVSYQKAEQKKYDDAVNFFEEFSLLTTLKEIFKDDYESDQIQASIKEWLKVDTVNLDYREIMSSYNKLMGLN